MTAEFTDLEQLLRELLEKMQTNQDGTWDWNAISGLRETAEPDKKLLPSGPMHKNSVCEICINLHGNGYVELKDRYVKLTPGQFLVIPEGTVYRECGETGVPCCNLWLNIGRLRGIRINVTISDEIGNVSLLHTKLVYIAQENYSALNETLSQELTGEQFGAATLVKSRLVEILVDIIRHLETKEHGQFAHKWQETLVAEAMEYLYRHGAEKTELADVAEHLAVSERQLNRIFKTATGTTVIHYFNKHRILQARYYLISTNLGLKEIAERLSYYDQYHFSRSFKKATGFTPSQFRKIRREG
jgi:AraC-like DNA-binding protein